MFIIVRYLFRKIGTWKNLRQHLSVTPVKKSQQYGELKGYDNCFLPLLLLASQNNLLTVLLLFPKRFNPV